MDEQEMDRIEQEQYMEELGRYIAEQRDIIRQCTERTEEIQERLNELQEDFEWEGLPETDEVQDLYAELTSLDMQILKAKQSESFYVTQLFREEIKELSPAEVSRLYDELGNLKITHTLMDDTLALKEVEEKQHILEDHIHSHEELSALFSQRFKSAKKETSQDVMDWLEGRTDTVKKETSPLQQKNKYKEYPDWFETIIQQCCNEENFRGEQILADNDRKIYKHFALDNNLHVYYSREQIGIEIEREAYIFDGESLLKYENAGRTQRCIHLSEYAEVSEYGEGDFYNFELEFTVGDVRGGDNVPGYIFYQDDSEFGVAFLPDKVGRNATSGQEIYLDEQLDLSMDIKDKLERAIEETEDPELQATYQRALEFYSKISELVKSQKKNIGEHGQEDVGILAKKEAELSSLEAEEKTISETEKLIAQKENEGQTI